MGAEAYIPLSPASAARSVAVAKEAVRRSAWCRANGIVWADVPGDRKK